MNRHGRLMGIKTSKTTDTTAKRFQNNSFSWEINCDNKSDLYIKLNLLAI